LPIAPGPDVIKPRSAAPAGSVPAQAMKPSENAFKANFFNATRIDCPQKTLTTRGKRAKNGHNVKQIFHDSTGFAAGTEFQAAGRIARR
jgi:hypothetical protein